MLRVCMCFVCMRMLVCFLLHVYECVCTYVCHARMIVCLCVWNVYLHTCMYKRLMCDVWCVLVLNSSCICVCARTVCIYQCMYVCERCVLRRSALVCVRCVCVVFLAFLHAFLKCIYFFFCRNARNAFFGAGKGSLCWSCLCLFICLAIHMQVYTSTNCVSYCVLWRRCNSVNDNRLRLPEVPADALCFRERSYKTNNNNNNIAQRQVNSCWCCLWCYFKKDMCAAMDWLAEWRSAAFHHAIFCCLKETTSASGRRVGVGAINEQANVDI